MLLVPLNVWSVQITFHTRKEHSIQTVLLEVLKSVYAVVRLSRKQLLGTVSETYYLVYSTNGCHDYVSIYDSCSFVCYLMTDLCD